jgi:predicted metal-dependent phosphoesterase TrpH
MKIDHHIHTSRHSPDSSIDPIELLEHAAEVGLDAVVITEHDYQWSADELAALAAQEPSIRVFSGAEISAREGHFLVYGLPSLDDAPPGIFLQDLLEVVRGHRAAIVAAHPFRWDQPLDQIIADHGPVFDALELVSNNIYPATRAKTQGLLNQYPMAATGSSDAHEIGVVGCYYSRFPSRIETVSEFVTALRQRQGRPGHRKGVYLTSGPVD